MTLLEIPEGRDLLVRDVGLVLGMPDHPRTQLGGIRFKAKAFEPNQKTGGASDADTHATAEVVIIGLRLESNDTLANLQLSGQPLNVSKSGPVNPSVLRRNEVVNLMKMGPASLPDLVYESSPPRILLSWPWPLKGLHHVRKLISF